MSSLEVQEAKAAEQREREKYTAEATPTHSREKIQLCQEVILDHFGSVAARVASALLQRGRLTLRELSRYLLTSTAHASSGLMQDQLDALELEGQAGDGSSTYASTSAAPLKSQRLIQQALLTLIQHNICWHVCIVSDDLIAWPGEDEAVGTEYFQINVDEVLPRMRFGAYLAIAEEQFGSEAYEIIDDVLQNGKARASDIVKRLTQDGDEQRKEKIEGNMRDLLYSAHLKPSMPKLQISPRDRRLAYEAERKQAHKKLLSAKDKLRIAIDAGKQLEEDEKSAWVWTGPGSTGRKRGLIPAPRKRTMNGKSQKRGRPSKQAKAINGKGKSLNLAVSESEEEEEEGGGTSSLQVDPNIFLRVNYDRFDVHIRDDIICRAVEQRYNKTSADVLQAMMRMSDRIKEDVPGTSDEQSPMLHINSIRKYLSEGIALKKAFDRDSLRNLLGSEPAQSALLAEVVAVLLGAGDISRSGLARRLVSPSAAVKASFVDGGASRTPPQLHIEYGNAARVLREQMLRNVVEAQFGTSGSRIMALVREMGRLEEKHISKLALMPMGETRDICARLFASSLLSLQEVPKSSERVATRTIFFWYVDERKCTAWLCDHFFKTLSRLSQRRRQELAREADLISRSLRTDVSDRQGYVQDVEKRRLQRLRETIKTITLAELRAWQDLFVVLQLPA